MELTGMTNEAKYQRWIGLLLIAQTLILIVASLNRLTDFSSGPVAANQFLRWRDFNHLMVFPPLTVLVAIGFRQVLLKVGKTQWGWVDILFVIAVYFLGAGYGVHELGNYLSFLAKSRDAIDPVFREVIRYNDDDFSHWVFFGAFIALNVVMLLWQAANPFQTRLSLIDMAICIINGLVLSAAIFVNLSRGDLGFDLVALLILAVTALVFWLKDKKQPMNIYYVAGLWPGLIATAIARMF
ncbi:MAG: hypothetical protein P1U86_12750 [Verrucomicrobiales bacterium]|nr:hypothetical protein [Verrucomicrobiales bacterium]